MRPIVALETTIVAHGFPPGEGLAVGRECERRVREGGAVPATVARNGRGAARGSRRRAAGARRRRGLGRTQGEPARSRRLHRRRHGLGATTVGATLAACRLAAISVLATGRHRRRPSWLRDAAGHLRRPRGARSHACSRRLLGREVAARRSRRRSRPLETLGVAGRRLRHRHGAALLRGREAARRRRFARTRPKRSPRSRIRIGRSNA